MSKFINFDTAKIAKQKGFDESVGYRYTSDGKRTGVKLGMYGNPNNYSDNYSAPTIDGLIMWLEKEHSIESTLESFVDDLKNLPDV